MMWNVDDLGATRYGESSDEYRGLSSTQSATGRGRLWVGKATTYDRPATH